MANKKLTFFGVNVYATARVCVRLQIEAADHASAARKAQRRAKAKLQAMPWKMAAIKPNSIQAGGVVQLGRFNAQGQQPDKQMNKYKRPKH